MDVTSRTCEQMPAVFVKGFCTRVLTEKFVEDFVEGA
jgi:hypothetical protein